MAGLFLAPPIEWFGFGLEGLVAVYALFLAMYLFYLLTLFLRRSPAPARLPAGELVAVQCPDPPGRGVPDLHVPGCPVGEPALAEPWDQSLSPSVALVPPMLLPNWPLIVLRRLRRRCSRSRPSWGRGRLRALSGTAGWGGGGGAPSPDRLSTVHTRFSPGAPAYHESQRWHPEHAAHSLVYLSSAGLLQ